ncbi:acyltransferase [Candidatus Gracilibacteria bacterium]|nr:acyltransferase [Candidatus Gracilibacteria bacterium]
MICALLPVHTGYRVRAAALRMVGFQIGRGTMFYDLPAISGSDELHNHLVIGKACRFNLRTSLELGARITIGDNVGVGAETMFLTTSHEFGPAERRCGPQRKGPITIGNGVWIGVRSTILPGVTIGDGAVVAAGSLVNRDVAANTLVAGVPAKQLKELAGFFVLWMIAPVPIGGVAATPRSTGVVIFQTTMFKNFTIVILALLVLGLSAALFQVQRQPGPVVAEQQSSAAPRPTLGATATPPPPTGTASADGAFVATFDGRRQRHSPGSPPPGMSPFTRAIKPTARHSTRWQPCMATIAPARPQRIRCRSMNRLSFSVTTMGGLPGTPMATAGFTGPRIRWSILALVRRLLASISLPSAPRCAIGSISGSRPTKKMCSLCLKIACPMATASRVMRFTSVWISSTARRSFALAWCAILSLSASRNTQRVSLTRPCWSRARRSATASNYVFRATIGSSVCQSMISGGLMRR